MLFIHWLQVKLLVKSVYIWAYKKRGTLPLLIFIVRFRKDPSYKNKQATPTLKIWIPFNKTLQRMLREWDNHIQTGIYCSLALDRMKFSGFHDAKTSANKRFIICLQWLLQRIIAEHTRPHTLSVSHYDCKGTTKIAHTQEKSKEKMPFMRIWHKWQLLYISKSV